MHQMFTRSFPCPWCGKSELLADGKAYVTVSTQCPKCRHIFVCDLQTGKAEKSQAQKRLGRKK